MTRGPCARGPNLGDWARLGVPQAPRNFRGKSKGNEKDKTRL